jgi:tetratricopeptide (TPR) repeat protein
LTHVNDLLKKYRVASAWLLVLLAALFYQGVLTCGFVLDDVALILQNPYVKNVHLWRRIFLTPMWSFLGPAGQGSFYRPLGVFSYWLVCRVAGLNPLAYHCLQLVLYALAIGMVYRIGREFLPTELAAFAGALLWTLHPLHVEAAAWAAATLDIECGLLCLVAFWLFLRAEKQSPPRLRGHALAAAAYFPALFCKELALAFPLLLLVYWFCFPTGSSWRRRALHWLPYAAAVAVCAVIRVAVMGHFSEHSLLRGLRPRVVWVAIGLMGEHFKLFFWPVHLSEFRDFRLAPSLHSPWPWVALVVMALAVLGRKRDPLLSFLVLWWFVLLLPCFDYRQLSFPLVEDQFSYIPSVGLCFAVSYLAFWRAPQLFPRGRVAELAAAALLVVGTLFAVKIVRSIAPWRSNDSLYAYALRVSPNAALAHVSHGVVLQLRDNDLEGAAHEFRTAIALNAQSLRPLIPVDYDSYVGLGQVELLRGHEPEALEYFQKAVHLLPRFGFAYQVLGSIYFPRGDYARAAEYFRLAVRANPMDLTARFYLGTCLRKIGQPGEAAQQFHAAREVDPEYSQAYTAEAAALEAAGDKASAARVRSEMLRAK